MVTTLRNMPYKMAAEIGTIPVRAKKATRAMREKMAGQGLIEYVLIIAVISLVIIFAGPAIAKAISTQFSKISDTLNSGTSTGFGH